ncbi:PLDc N-terminal domain-containing protein [Streptomyces sp. NPDC046985]|uniref:PLDc N-terminal domain-containing protein n=1 Tax=Streptomyces sp. NPDC046985 TaxID=3155377 RepID=UPI0033E8015E
MLADSLSPSPSASAPWVALVPLVALLPALLCMVDVVRHQNTRSLTPQTWLAICAFGNVFGLVAYLKFGRSEDR